MNCPVCPNQSLVPTDSPSDPLTHVCPSCRGRFLAFNDHLAWLERTSTGPVRPPEVIPTLPASTPPEPARKARVCPHCSRILTRFRISLDLPFTLDRCATCAGVWFDAPEWQLVHDSKLLPGLHHLFNDTHQHKLATEERRRLHDARCRTIVGDESFDRIRAFKQWVDAHPHKDVLMAFLEDHVQSDTPKKSPASKP